MYAGHIQDLVKQHRSFQFYLLLYLRDQGVKHGGYEYKMDQKLRTDIRRDYSQYSREKSDIEYNDIVAAPVLSYNDMELLKLKSNRTEGELYSMRKYYAIEHGELKR